jgi:hypothetical protein
MAKKKDENTFIIILILGFALLLAYNNGLLGQKITLSLVPTGYSLYGFTNVSILSNVNGLQSGPWWEASVTLTGSDIAQTLTPSQILNNTMNHSSYTCSNCQSQQLIIHSNYNYIQYNLQGAPTQIQTYSVGPLGNGNTELTFQSCNGAIYGLVSQTLYTSQILQVSCLPPDGTQGTIQTAQNYINACKNAGGYPLMVYGSMPSQNSGKNVPITISFLISPQIGVITYLASILFSPNLGISCNQLYTNKVATVYQAGELGNLESSVTVSLGNSTITDNFSTDGANMQVSQNGDLAVQYMGSFTSAGETFPITVPAVVVKNNSAVFFTGSLSNILQAESSANTSILGDMESGAFNYTQIIQEVINDNNNIKGAILNEDSQYTGFKYVASSNGAPLYLLYNDSNLKIFAPMLAIFVKGTKLGLVFSSSQLKLTSLHVSNFTSRGTGVMNVTFENIGNVGGSYHVYVTAANSTVTPENGYDGFLENGQSATLNFTIQNNNNITKNTTELDLVHICNANNQCGVYGAKYTLEPACAGGAAFNPNTCTPLKSIVKNTSATTNGVGVTPINNTQQNNPNSFNIPPSDYGYIGLGLILIIAIFIYFKNKGGSSAGGYSSAQVYG